MAKVRDSYIIISIIIFFLFSVSILQQMFIPNILREQLEIFNKSSSSIIVDIEGIDVKIPFLIKIKSVFARKKTDDTPILMASNVQSNFSIKGIFRKTISIPNLYIKKLNIINRYKSNNSQSSDINFPKLDIKNIMIQSIELGNSIIDNNIISNPISFSGSFLSNNNFFKLHSLIKYGNIVIESQSCKPYNDTIQSKVKAVNIPRDLLKYTNIFKGYLYIKSINHLSANIDMLDIYSSPNAKVNILSSCTFKTPLQEDNQRGRLNLSASITPDCIDVTTLNMKNTYSSHELSGIINNTSKEYTFNLNSILFNDISVYGNKITSGKQSSLSILLSGKGMSGTGNIKIESDFININKEIFKNKLNSIEVRSPIISSEFEYTDENICGEIKLSGNYGYDISGSTGFSYLLETKQLGIHKARINRNNSYISADIKAIISNQNILPSGNIIIQCDNLGEWSDLLNKDTWGSLNLKLKLNHKNNQPTIKAVYKINEAKYSEISADSLFGNATVTIDNKHNVLYDAKLSGKYIISDHVQINDLHFSSISNDGVNHDLFYYVSGFCIQPFSIYMDMSINSKSNNNLLKVDVLNSLFGKTEINLLKPVFINLSKDSMSISDFKIDIGNGYLAGSGTVSNEENNLLIEAVNIPYTVAKTKLKNKYSGIANLTASIFNERQGLAVNIKGDTEFYNIDKKFADISPSTKISIDALIKNNNASISSSIFSNNLKIGSLNINAPTSYLLSKKLILDDKNSSYQDIDLWFKGDLSNTISPILGIDLSGNLNTKIHIMAKNGKISSSGFIDIIDGVINLPNRGFYAEGIQSLIKLKQSNILVEHIYARDGEGGRITGNGKISLNHHDKYKYILCLGVERFKIISLKYLNASIQGHAVYEGNINSGTITGNLDIVDMFASIDDPKNYIKTKVFQSDYIHDFPESENKENMQIMLNKFPDIMLDLNVNTEETSRFVGSGIDSYWSGSVHVSGSINTPKLTGLLNLSSGTFYSFVLGNRIFDLQKGSIMWNKSNFDSYSLSALGALDISGYNILVNLGVKNNKWDLHIQSEPFLSKHDIASLIIFDSTSSNLSNSNKGNMATVLWKMLSGLSRGYISNIMRNNIKMQIPVYAIEYSSLDSHNLMIQLGLSPIKDFIFLGGSYHSGVPYYGALGFIDAYINNNIKLSLSAGKDIILGSCSFELAF